VLGFERHTRRLLGVCLIYTEGDCTRRQRIHLAFDAFMSLILRLLDIACVWSGIVFPFFFPLLPKHCHAFGRHEIPFSSYMHVSLHLATFESI